MRISISISDICRRIYAVSAIRAVNAPGGSDPAVLTRDNDKLLRRLVRDCFARTVGELAALVQDFSPLYPEDDGDILWIDFRGVSAVPGAAGESLATAVLASVLTEAFADSEPGSSRQYGAVMAGALANLRRGTARCGRLTPHDGISD